MCITEVKRDQLCVNLCKEYGKDLVIAMTEDLGYSLEDAAMFLENGDYCVYDASDYETLGKIYTELHCVIIPKELHDYFDFARYGRDIYFAVSGNFVEIDGRTVFLEVFDC